MTKITTTQELQQVHNLIAAIKTGKLKTKPLCKLAGLSNHNSLRDTVRGKALLSQQNFIAIKKAVNTIRNQVKKLLYELDNKTIPDRVVEGIKTLFQRKEVAWFVVLQRNRQHRNKFDGWILDRRSFPIESLDYLKSCLLIFLTETALN